LQPAAALRWLLPSERLSRDPEPAWRRLPLPGQPHAFAAAPAARGRDPDPPRAAYLLDLQHSRDALQHLHPVAHLCLRERLAGGPLPRCGLRTLAMAVSLSYATLPARAGWLRPLLRPRQ